MPTNILNDNNWTTGFVVHFQTNPFGIFSWVGFGLGMWVYMVPKNFMVAGLYSKQMPTSLRHCTHKPTWHSMGHKFVGIWQPDDQNSWTFFQTPKLFDDHNGFSTPQKIREYHKIQRWIPLHHVAKTLRWMDVSERHQKYMRANMFISSYLFVGICGLTRLPHPNRISNSDVLHLQHPVLEARFQISRNRNNETKRHETTNQCAFCSETRFPVTSESHHAQHSCALNNSLIHLLAGLKSKWIPKSNMDI